MKFLTKGPVFATSLALVGLLAAPAFAQTSTTNSTTGNPNTGYPTTRNSNSALPSEGRPGGTGLSPSATSNSSATNSQTNKSASSADMSSGSGFMGDRVQQVHGAYLSSKLVGATVYNDHKDSIGSIDNLMIDPSGRITEAVISVGGFLGVGSKLVEVPFNELQFQQDGNGSGRKVMLPHATQESLKSMQEFTYNG